MQNNYEHQIMLRDKRSIVLTIATRTGIKEPNSWSKFNIWMLTTSVLKKEMHKYSLEELELLIKQFRGLENNNHKSSLKIGTKAWFQKNGYLSFNQN